MTQLIRAAALTAFPEIARSVGLRPDSLLSEVGIDRRALDDPDMRIPARAVRQLFELAAQQSKVETFGLRMGETRSVAILGPIGLLLREEPTVRHAVQSLAKYMFLHNESLVLQLDEVEDQAVVSLERHLVQHQHERSRQAMELSIAVLHRILQPSSERHGSPSSASRTNRRPAATCTIACSGRAWTSAATTMG